MNTNDASFKINIRQLEAFRAVMQSGTVTGAADLLCLTQPTVSKLISDLELNSGLTLFDRAHGRLVPRPETSVLLRQIERVFETMDDVKRNANQLARGQMGHLRIAAIPALSMEFLPKAIATFLETRPDVTIELTARAANRVTEWIAGQRADLGFIFGSTSATDINDVKLKQIGILEGICALHHSHRLARKSEIDAKDLEGERFISLGRDSHFRQQTDRLFEEHNISRNLVVETGYSTTACAFVKDKVGVAIIDPITAKENRYRKDIVFRSFRPRISFALHSVISKTISHPVLLLEFVTHLNGYYTLLEQENPDDARVPPQKNQPLK